MKSNQLKSKIALKKTSQTELANKKGVTLNTINNQINSRSELTVSDILFYCDELDINDPIEICQIFLDINPKNGKKSEVKNNEQTFWGDKNE